MINYINFLFVFSDKKKFWPCQTINKIVNCTLTILFIRQLKFIYAWKHKQRCCLFKTFKFINVYLGKICTTF